MPAAVTKAAAPRSNGAVVVVSPRQTRAGPYGDHHHRTRREDAGRERRAGGRAESLDSSGGSTHVPTDVAAANGRVTSRTGRFSSSEEEQLGQRAPGREQVSEDAPGADHTRSAATNATTAARTPAPRRSRRAERARCEHRERADQERGLRPGARAVVSTLTAPSANDGHRAPPTSGRRTSRTAPAPPRPRAGRRRRRRSGRARADRGRRGPRPPGSTAAPRSSSPSASVARSSRPRLFR